MRAAMMAAPDAATAPGGTDECANKFQQRQAHLLNNHR
jgi:hypothetical protein